MPTIDTERVPLQQVFMNLINNAIKYADRSDPRISLVSLSRRAEHPLCVSAT